MPLVTRYDIRSCSLPSFYSNSLYYIPIAFSFLGAFSFSLSFHDGDFSLWLISYLPNWVFRMKLISLIVNLFSELDS